MIPAMTKAPRSALVSLAFILAAAGACAPQPNAGRMAVVDDVRFDYVLQPAGAPHAYQVNLNLSDPKTGAPIRKANVAVNVFGPGYSGDLVNLKRNAGGGYDGQVTLPQAASYKLTFQVNRAPAPSAEAVFAVTPPSQVASAAAGVQPAR